MSFELIGMVATKEVSESGGCLDGPVIDRAYLTRFAQAHEAAGFDRVLIGYGATGPDGFAVAAHVLYATSTLGVLIAHHPGFAAPTLVARKLAPLDQLTGGGRIAIHHISGGDELDQKRDGDFAGHDRRYARTAELMTLLRRELTEAAPFDYDGEFYRVRGACSSVRPPAGGIPLFFGGASAAAVGVGAEHADVQPVGPADRGGHRGSGLGARGDDQGGGDRAHPRVRPAGRRRGLGPGAGATPPRAGRLPAAGREPGVRIGMTGPEFPLAPERLPMVTAALAAHAGECDRDGCFPAAGIAKLTGTRAAIAAIGQAVALVGNNALTRKNPLQRHYRDVLCARVHTPQDDSIIAAAGNAAFGSWPGGTQ